MGLRDLQTIFHRLQNIFEHAGGVEYLNTDEGPVGVEFKVQTRRDLQHLLLLAFLANKEDVLFRIVAHLEVLLHIALHRPDASRAIF